MKKTFIFKSDLAQAYFPYIDQRSARQKLMSLINSSASLLTRLRSAGYTDAQRLLSPLQVDIIMDAFGNPFN